MAVDDLAGHRIGLLLAQQHKRSARADPYGEQDRGGVGEPSWRTQRRRRPIRRRLTAEREADLRTQRLGRPMDRSGTADVVAQPLERRCLGPAIGTVLQMAAQRYPLGLGEFAIEIGVEPGAHLIAFHYPHPFPSQARRSAARARCNRDITVPIGTPVTSAIWR